MDCPVCGERLREIERSGVLVDICPSCKGVWLDRGEIDKLIAVESNQPQIASMAQTHGRDAGQERREYRTHDDRDHDDHDHRRRDYEGGSYGASGRKRKSSLLSDILGGLGGD